VGETLVERIRSDMESGGAIPKVEMREGRDGKLRSTTQQKAKPEPEVATPPTRQRHATDVEEAPTPQSVNRIVDSEVDEGDALESILEEHRRGMRVPRILMPWTPIPEPWLQPPLPLRFSIM